MAKWQFNRPGTWAYDSLGFIAENGDILEADSAPDAWWDSVTDTGQAETVEYTGKPNDPAPYAEPGDGWVWAYNSVTNRMEFRPPSALGGSGVVVVSDESEIPPGTPADTPVIIKGA